MPLAWFRRHKSGDQSIPEAHASDVDEVAAAPVPAAADEAPGTEPETDTDADTGAAGDTPARPKRRRGSRGGRRRRKPGEATTGEEQADEAAAEAKPARDKPQREKPERKEASQQSQRRARKESSTRRRPPRRAPLPKAKRELLVSVDAGEKRVAVLEDDRVAEVYLERPERRSIAGNIYKGVVDNVLPGMEAAFVEIGLEKNGFLYVDEIVEPQLEGRKGARKIQDLISKGQEILVQTVKDPMKTKGARLTTEISLPGRFVVYQPHGEGLGVSRRLEDDERTRLKAILKEIAPKKGGVIVRTAAEGASAEDIGRDLEFLERLWKTIETQAKGAKPPMLVYQEAELPLRVTRDLFTGDFEKAYVDHDRTYKRIVGYLKKTSPHMVERVVRYKEREPLMDAFGVDAEIKSTLNKRVDLPSGGYLIFDYAEAFTVVDVNTGRFVGGRGKNSNARLEDTITKNNLEAVKEVVRQLRLRDIGGIIVIDFIDMANPKNRQAVEEALRSELERDRTKTYVVEISPLGLVEMTRQNVTDGPREVMTKKCPTCGGDGIVVSENTAAVEVERRLRQLVTPGSRTQAYRVEVSARIASILVGPGACRLAEIEETARRTFFLVGKEDVHLDHFAVLEQGPLEKLRPEAPVEDGKTISVKLGELARHDAQAAVAHLDGYAVCVADAAKLVGKTVKVKIERAMDGVAYATLAGSETKAVEPITAEKEAERPTRARRPAARAHGSAPPDAETEDGAEELEAGAAELEEDTETDAEADDDGAAGATVKKRTRRGSRGGRRRKRKPTEAGGEEAAEDADGEVDADEEPDATAEPGGAPTAAPQPGEDTGADEPAPRIHLPEPDLGREDEEDAETGETPRKKTRRGSRGGRRRKKRPVGAVDGESAVGEAGDEEPSADDEVVADEEPVSVAALTAAVEPAADMDVEPEPELEREAEPMDEPEPEPEVESVPEAESEPEPEAAAEPAPERGAEPEGDPESVSAADDAAEPAGWTYVPMSEWEDDFRR